MPSPVIIVDYDPRWPLLYEEEWARILDAIGHAVVAIEHVGSTSVPGLGAKPIIDIMVGLSRLADADECIAPLQGIGYQYVPEFEAFIPERRYFHKGPEHARTHHLHMVETASAFWERHLLFRDFLRTHEDVAHQYEALKRQLAKRFGTDREGYTEAKTQFIRTVEERVRGMKSAKPPTNLSA